MTVPDKAYPESVAQSNVDMITHCLNTPPEEHIMECSEERWSLELGERPGVYLAMEDAMPGMAWWSAATAWLYRRGLLDV